MGVKLFQNTQTALPLSKNGVIEGSLLKIKVLGVNQLKYVPQRPSYFALDREQTGFALLCSTGPNGCKGPALSNYGLRLQRIQPKTVKLSGRGLGNLIYLLITKNFCNYQSLDCCKILIIQRVTKKTWFLLSSILTSPYVAVCAHIWLAICYLSARVQHLILSIIFTGFTPSPPPHLRPPCRLKHLGIFTLTGHHQYVVVNLHDSTLNCFYAAGWRLVTLSYLS